MFAECEECEEKIKCALQTKVKFGEEHPCRRFYDNYDRINQIVNNYIYNVKLPANDYRIECVWSAIEDKVKELLETSYSRPFVKVFLRPELRGEVTIMVYISCGRIHRSWQHTYVADEEENFDV